MREMSDPAHLSGAGGVLFFAAPAAGCESQMALRSNLTRVCQRFSSAMQPHAIPISK